jgi:hypothetical protein
LNRPTYQQENFKTQTLISHTFVPKPSPYTPKN